MQTNWPEGKLMVTMSQRLLPEKEWMTKRHKKVFGDDEYVGYFDCGDIFINTYICQKLIQVHTLNMCS